MEPILYAFTPARRSWGVRPLPEQRRLLALRTLPTAHQRLIRLYQAARQQLAAGELPQAA